MEQHPFFVYGTLRTGGTNWQRLLRGRTTAQAAAILPGARLYAPGLPYVTDGRPDEQVVGDLFDVAEADYQAVLADLDRLEGHPRHYRRSLRSAVTAAVTRQAWVYLAAERAAATLDDRDLVAGGDWFSVKSRLSPRGS